MKLCVISESPRWAGVPLFQVEDPRAFYRSYSDWISEYLIINELFMMRPFMELLEADGWAVHIAESAKSIMADYDRWSRPLDIEGFDLRFPDGTASKLFAYQEFGLNRALDRSSGRTAAQRLFFYGWATGTGKSALSAAGAQELFNRNEVDVVLGFTLKTLRRSLFEFYTGTTQLDTRLVNGSPAKRRDQYQAGHQVYILNYDKAHFDRTALLDLVKDKRVLFVMDEVQKVLTDKDRIRARRGLDDLIKASRSILWPMSASVVSQTPLRYRDVYSLSGGKNPLGTRKEFEDAYLESKRAVEIPTKWDRPFVVWYYDWNVKELQDVRHRVADRTQSVRKTDPGVRENFKGMQTIPVSLELSEQDRRLYSAIKDRAAEAKEAGQSIEPYYRLLRYVCNTPESLGHSRSELAQEFVTTHSSLINSTHSAKMETVMESLEAIRDSGDKAVVFTSWTRLSLDFLSREMDKRKIRHVSHFGTGMTDRQRDAAVSEFKTNSDITVFLSSDAGAFGLSFQMARYVINYDTPFSYDTLMQRNNRIDRADSYLDGLTSYVYVTKGTIEERIWKTNNKRRELASATTGAKETLSYGADEYDPEMLDFLVFGEGE